MANIIVTATGGAVVQPTVHNCAIPLGHAAINFIKNTALPQLDPQGIPTGTSVSQINLYPNADGSWTAQITYQ